MPSRPGSGPAAATLARFDGAAGAGSPAWAGADVGGRMLPRSRWTSVTRSLGGVRGNSAVGAAPITDEDGSGAEGGAGDGAALCGEAGVCGGEAGVCVAEATAPDAAPGPTGCVPGGAGTGTAG